MNKGRGMHLRIRGQIILYFATLLSIPILILGIFSYQQAREHLENQSIIAMENNLSNLITEMNNRSERETAYIKYLAYNLNFRKILEEDPVDRVKLAMELNNSVEPILWYYATSDSYVKSIEIITEKLDIGLGSFLKPAALFSEDPWYQNSSSTNANLWHVQNGNLFITRQILDTAVADSIAVMRINLFSGSFLSPFDEFRYLDNGVVVADQEHNIIFARGTGSAGVDAKAETAIHSDDLQDTNLYLMRHGTIENSGWNVYYYIDRAMITGQLHSILQRTLQVVLIVLLIAVIVISLFSRRLSSRILLLRDYAERVASGDLEVTPETNDSDEIGIVMNSFSTMTRRLNQMIDEIYKMQVEKKAVELKALQAQINPHFLYNVLSSIKWKALRNGDDSISDIAGLTATFYRTSLNNGEAFTSVSSELNNVRAYVEIQKHMHEFPFTVEYDVKPEALDCQMLNFLLQPIVENAFKHGIDYTDETRNGRLIIRCYTEDKYLIFQIKNNGPQIEREKARQALKLPGKRYGLFNIQERIQLYYMEDCGIDADIDDDGFTSFTVRILKCCTSNEGNSSIK